VIPEALLNSIFCKSSEQMDELPDNSVHLMVTSPPYNVGKEYDQDFSFSEYREFLRRVWQEVYRVLVPGGRICINVANLGRKPYIPLHAYLIEDLLELGFLMRGEVIWNKGSSASPSTAFLEFTRSVWSFPAVSAKKVGHPAPFPEELPYRCIQLYTFKGEVVLDPFMGSGQTALACLRTGRYYIGYDISPEYVALAQRRIQQWQATAGSPRLF